METEEIITNTLVAVLIVLILCIIGKAYYDGNLLGFLKLSGGITLISGIAFLIYYISTYISNKDNSSFLRSVFGLSIIILVSIIGIILSMTNLKPYIDGLLNFFGLINGYLILLLA